MTTRNIWTTTALVLALGVAPAARSAEAKKDEAAKPAEAAAKPAAAADKPAEAPANAPKIEFEKDTVDLGDVVKGEKAVFTFSFKNTGKSDLELKEAKPSCGCTVADYTRTVKPGESGKVTASVDTSRFKGPITKTVTVTSTDPVNSTIHLQAKANVKSLVDVSPSENVYFRIFRNDDQPTKRVLTITGDAENPFEVSGVESSNPMVTTNLINNTAKGEKAASNYTLEVDVKKDAPIGPVVGVVTVKTNHKKVPTIAINVNGQVLGDVLVTPQKIYLGQVTKETANSIKRTVRIERRSGNDFKIAKVESSSPSIKAEIAPVEDGKVYTVTITVGDNLPAGAVNANITVNTNDKEQPKIDIPVVGTVAG